MSWLTPSSNEDAAGTVNGKMQTMLSHQVQGRFSGQPSPDSGPADRASRSTDGSRQELWATPCQRDHHPNGEMQGSKTDLGNQVQWPTPMGGAYTEASHGALSGDYKTAMKEKGVTGKLNPHWVFCLMGYPPLWAELGRKFTTASRNSKPPATQSCQK
ncbi:MAG: hypothetical protein WCP34_06420 [Pseudomonadota bacterium]